MTAPMNPGEQAPENAQQSLCGLPAAVELLRVRIQPAQFARALGVSKQSVSRWARDGWITLGADGRLDPTVAIGQLLRRCDPGRLRARWLRQAVDEVQGLRDNLANAEDRATAAEAALREAQREIAHLERWNADGDAHAETFRALLIKRGDELRAAPPEVWEKTLSELSDAAWDVVDPEEAADALDVSPLDLELDATLAADWAAFNARLPPPRRELSDTEGDGGA